MYGNLLAQLHLVQDLMYTSMNMVGFKKRVMRIVSTIKNKTDSHRSFRMAFNDIVQIRDFEFNNTVRIMIASPEDAVYVVAMSEIGDERAFVLVLTDEIHDIH